MRFGSIIGLIFLFSGVLSAPSDSPDTLDKEISDPVPPAVTHQFSAESSSVQKGAIASSEDKDEKEVSSLLKDDKGSKQAKLNGDSSLSEENAGVKSEMKGNAEMSSSSKPEDENNVDAVSKDTKYHTVVEVSPDIVDVQIDNEIEDKKVKEIVLKAVTSVPISQDSKLESQQKLPSQKPGVSQVIGNFIYEMIQAPIYLLRAFQALIGGVLGIRQPVTTAATVTANTAG